jgi:hypothetical protein
MSTNIANSTIACSRLREILLRYPVKKSTADLIKCLFYGDITVLGLIPYSIEKISRDVGMTYGDLVRDISSLLELTHEQILYVHLSPKIRDLIPRMTINNDIDVPIEYDYVVGIDNELEVVALRWAMSQLGGIFSTFVAGTLLFGSPGLPETCYDMPNLARLTLIKAFKQLSLDKNAALRTKMNVQYPSLLRDAHIKLILSSLACGESLTDLLPSIEFLELHYPQDERWVAAYNYEPILLVQTLLGAKK